MKETRLLSDKIFLILAARSFKNVNGKSKAKQQSKNTLIYDDKCGLLYFNEDGKEKGWEMVAC